MSDLHTISTGSATGAGTTFGGKLRLEFRNFRPRMSKPRKGDIGLLTFAVCCGVAMPLATLLVEFFSHMCADTFFDPIPTVGHIVLVLFVPLANAALCWAVWTESFVQQRLLLLTNAFAIGVSSFYSLLFLPLLPLAVLAVVFGIGILPLSPPLAVLAAILLRRRLRDRLDKRSSQRWPRVWPGFALALVVLVLLDVPPAITRLSLQQAVSVEPATRARGIWLLRQFGDRDTMLRACYDRQGRPLDIMSFVLSLGRPVSTEEARGIYYRVTGTSFESAPAPAFSGRGAWLPDFEFDEHRGGTITGPVLQGLSLEDSRLDASIDTAGALAYWEWTMTLRNSRTMQREARAQLRLPPGSTVSRVTLWINGEEREAAFGGRAETRLAYENVVRARRDPLLVTTSGPDQVLIQCFPVPPNGEMKIRIGLTQPLIAGTGENWLVAWPHFVERNFSLKDGEHEVWVESGSKLESANAALHAETTSGGAFALRGRLDDSSLRTPLGLQAPRRSMDGVAWTPDPLDSAYAVRQRMEHLTTPRVSRVIVVVDGSLAMKPFLTEIADALAAAPEMLHYEVLVAGDGVTSLDDPRRLTSLAAEGGTDSVPALLQARELAVGGDHEAVLLWIHGPQPVLLERTDGLQSWWRRRPGHPMLYALEAAPGLNRVIENLDELPEVKKLLRRGGLRDDVARTLRAWSQPRSEPVVVRERVQAQEPVPTEWGAKTSGHLARLWAGGEVLRLMQARGTEERAQAIALASAYQIVTPVSGAVVLETQAQYDQAGLKPADPSKVPTIPEPEVWLLVFAVSGLLAWQLWRRRRAWNGI